MIKQGLKKLYWDLCWHTWCSDPMEQSLAELHQELAATRAARYQTEDRGDRVTAWLLPKRDATQISPISARQDPYPHCINTRKQ